MKKIKLLAFVAIALGTTGCSSTSVEEITKQSEKSDVVTVTAKAPVFNTRAASGYVLRYKAFLFKEDIDNNKLGAIVAAQEKLHTEGVGANFTFDVAEEDDYVILFVADYINSTSLTNKNLMIGDKSIGVNGYSDNSSCYNLYFNFGIKGALTMKTDESEAFAPYNNDNYEVFCGKYSFTKEHTKMTLPSVMLKRPVCKITIADVEESVEDYKVDVTKFNMGIKYDIYNEKVSAPEQYEEDDDNFIINSNMDVANSGNNELFYFYAFANPGSDGMQISEDGMSFTAKKGTTSIPCTIKKDNFVFKPNYKYTLKGSFLNPNKTEVKISVNVNPNWDGTTEQDI